VSPQPSSPAPLVGNSDARSVHGLSAGSDVAFLGGAGPGPGPSAVLELVRPAGVQADLGGPVAGAMSRLAELASASDDVPLVVVAADLSTSVPALLDLLDKPGVATGVAVVLPGSVDRGLDHLPMVRVGPDGKLLESVGVFGHAVTRPNRVLPGVLRVAPEHRGAAAAAWREATVVARNEADPFAEERYAF